MPLSDFPSKLPDNEPRKTSGRSRVGRIMSIGLTVALLVVILVSFQIYDVYTNKLPSFEQLHNIEPSLKTQIYARDGSLLQEYYNENRSLTPYKDFPPHLVNMLLAVEDRQFFNHWGINLPRTIWVVAKNFYNLKNIKAVSTVTQQLSRLLFVGRERTVVRKIKEALTAIKLERNYSKEEILQMYLNQYYFGRGAYGISAAARTYFDKTVQELDIKDCAFLIAILKAPSRYGANHELARIVRDRALYAFFKTENIARSEYDSLRAADLGLNTPERNVGRAPYFTEITRQYIQEKYGDDALYSAGLRVFTTLDWSMQEAAEKALNRRIDSLRARVARTTSIEDEQFRIQVPDTLDEFGRPVFELKKIQGALVAIDNETGSIVSMVGGRDFQESKFNRAIQAQRQPGSAFKPFVYTAAIDNGFRPMDVVYDNPIVLDIPGAKQWRPANFDNKFMGPMTVRDGLRLSRNLVAIGLLLKVTAPQVIFYAKRFGITSPIPNVPSIGIGSNEVSVLDLTTAYTIFPNHGIRINTHFISKIVDRYGNVLEEVLSPVKEEVLSEESAYIMVDMLKTVTDYGTGRGVRSRGFYRPTGGKTGTTNSYTDNWYVGFTPQITCGVWIGFDDKTTLGPRQYGSTNALPVWVEFMKSAHDSLPIEDFGIPENILFANVCLESQSLATNLCDDVRYEVFTSHSIPIKICPQHPSSQLYPGIAKYDYYKKSSDGDDEDRVTF